MSKKNGILRTYLLTLLALTAFASNSILCRLALGEHTIDAAGFTSVRLFSGALVLYLLLVLRNNGKSKTSRGSWFSGLILFSYAAAFSFAYISLSTGTGALILFGAVQLVMILSAVRGGDRLSVSEWSGAALAFGGLLYLVFPGLEAPSLSGSLLMTIAGISWGIYSLRGKGIGNPLADTAFNFMRTLPLVILLSVLFLAKSHLSARGILLAALSGGLASGVGYAVWYAAMKGLGKTQAAVVQLLVPVLAALGGMVFMNESISFRFVIATLLIFSGVGMALFAHSRVLVHNPPPEVFINSKHH